MEAHGFDPSPRRPASSPASGPADQSERSRSAPGGGAATPSGLRAFCGPLIAPAPGARRKGASDQRRRRRRRRPLPGPVWRGAARRFQTPTRRPPGIGPRRRRTAGAARQGGARRPRRPLPPATPGRRAARRRARRTAAGPKAAQMRRERCARPAQRSESDGVWTSRGRSLACSWVSTPIAALVQLTRSRATGGRHGRSHRPGGCDERSTFLYVSDRSALNNPIDDERSNLLVKSFYSHDCVCRSYRRPVAARRSLERPAHDRDRAKRAATGAHSSLRTRRTSDWVRNGPSRRRARSRAVV